jgi:hypothetical protein
VSADNEQIVFAEFFIRIEISKQCFDNASGNHLDEISDGCDGFIDMIENIKQQYIEQTFKPLDRVTIETGTR